jgi:hypothetical protein
MNQDGKSYILSAKVFKLHPDPRSRGFTLVAQTHFASLEDMQYYDDHDEGHLALKAKVGPRVEGGKAGTMVVYMPAESVKL